MSNSNQGSQKGAAATGIIAAFAASSCCIPPVIAAIAGVGGAAGSLAWMEPLRPYLIGVAVLAIGYAWYNHFKPKPADDCGCDIEKPKWYLTKGFLIGTTLFAAISISFPYYSGIFFSNNQKEVLVVNASNIETLDVSIEGMTCDACQNHVNSAVNELSGIVRVNSSYADGNAIVEFDRTKTSENEIEEAINGTGYMVTEIKNSNRNE
ncbi:MAG: mercuric transport protein MerTP [Flavobacteriales bacterium]